MIKDDLGKGLKVKLFLVDGGKWYLHVLSGAAG